MNLLSKKKFYSPILYDIYGSLNGEPVLVLEDIFFSSSKSELESIYFGGFKVFHLKRFQWEDFPFEEKSFLEEISKRLEEIILLSEKWSILAEGYSCGLALKLVLENETKISDVHLLSPIYEEEKEVWEYWNDFWFWFQREKEAIRYFYKAPYLLDFFLKNLNLFKLVSKTQVSRNIQFWLPVHFSIEKSLKLQQEFPKSEVNRIDKSQNRLSLHNPLFQKIFSWKKISGL